MRFTPLGKQAAVVTTALVASALGDAPAQARLTLRAIDHEATRRVCARISRRADTERLPPPVESELST